MKKTFFSLVLAAIAAFNLNAGEINVFAAANVTYAFNELKAEFAKTNPDTKVTVTLGGSGALTTQIKNGAPADVFMAANMKFVENLDEAGFSATRPIVYAQGALALFSIRDIDFTKGIKAVEGLKAVAIALPESAPYGKASIEALKKDGIFDKVEKNIIYTKSISEALSSALSAADAGFIAASAMYDPKMSKYKEGKNFILVNPALYTPIDQGVILLKRGENNPEAKAFYDFILSEKAKEIFRKFGYNI
ncbi:molybdate ABC transporter substrate-binding protein [Campylobacter sp. CCUG 57310]|uniref:molybdate ABC transporter substrate-binding protein n=1 Tax=Campylobacter sp. CCUG 57310 TaxID=2517362 RepID=UPI00156501FA|nr:molybdate ABC transporter substrate-binding protein [Campylobacter sp. CCUG 57310]QKF91513.1 molybdenum ABC transporter ModABC, periplasmic molybdate-binding protein [Campylobacter sp. CCUG 57310]